MTIHDEQKFMASLPDWGVLAGCFGGQIRPTDIDGCVQRGSRLLFLEHKGARASVGRGQAIMYDELARQGHTVLVFWTDDVEKQNVIRISRWSSSGCVQLEPPCLDTLRRCCRDWYDTTEAEYRSVYPRDSGSLGLRRSLETKPTRELLAMYAELIDLPDELSAMAATRLAILRDLLFARLREAAA